MYLETGWEYADNVSTLLKAAYTSFQVITCLCKMIDVTLLGNRLHGQFSSLFEQGTQKPLFFNPLKSV